MEIYITLLFYFFMKTKCKLLVGEIEIYLPTMKRAPKFSYFLKKKYPEQGGHFVTKGF